MVRTDIVAQLLSWFVESIQCIAFDIVLWSWRSGNIIARINEVTLRRARLVLGWVTVFCG